MHRVISPALLLLATAGCAGAPAPAPQPALSPMHAQLYRLGQVMERGPEGLESLRGAPSTDGYGHQLNEPASALGTCIVDVDHVLCQRAVEGELHAEVERMREVMRTMPPAPGWREAKHMTEGWGYGHPERGAGFTLRGWEDADGQGYVIVSAGLPFQPPTRR